MSMPDRDRRTEPATPRRRRQAREKGQVARSRELPAAIVLLAAAALIRFGGGTWLSWWIRVFRHAWAAPYLQEGNLGSRWGLDLLLGLIVPVGAVTVVLLVAGVGATLLQGGVAFSWESLAPNLDRLNPAQGIRRMFSRQAWAMLAVNVVKAAVIAGICYSDLKQGMVQLLNARLEQNIAATLDLVTGLLFKLGIILLIIGAADYLYQRWEFEQSLKMTREEVEREYKETEGDPQMRARRRELRQRLIRFQITTEVPKATVVVTNPTHYAVALRWREGVDPAPVVVAKGMDEVAFLIRDIAAENGVPVMENRPLARALYAAVAVGDEIPPDFFEAVAQFLYLVFQTYPGGKAPRVRRRRHRTDERTEA